MISNFIVLFIITLLAVVYNSMMYSIYIIVYIF
jgi:hypothetical protein